MADSRAGVRAREGIEAISAASPDVGVLRRDALDVLRPVIQFDAYVWLLTDPVTTVGAAPLADVPCLPELAALIKAKYTTTVNRWTALQAGPTPVARLHDAVDGELNRSHVWQQVLGRYAISDVASAVFDDQFGCWGFLDLWRTDNHEPFSRTEADLIAGVVPSLTAGLRRCQAETFVEPAVAQRPERGPVVLTLDDDLRITSRTAASQSWLDTLLPPRPDERGVPASVYNVAAQLLAERPASTTVRHRRGSISPTGSGSPCARPGSPPTSRRRPPW